MKKTLKRFKATGKKLFLHREEINTTDAGIILLSKEGFNLPPYHGTIISVGDRVEDKDYKIGVRVLYHDLGGFEFEYDNEKIYCIREKDVAAILEKNDKID